MKSTCPICDDRLTEPGVAPFHSFDDDCRFRIQPGGRVIKSEVFEAKMYDL